MTAFEAGRVVRCRYLRRNDVLCTGEAVDPDGEILLCTKHLARAMRLVDAATGRRATGGQR
jgi:hypothetical protein